jgi:hypothetical protein
MDRYTWYNGFIYMGYLAVLFLFELKAFQIRFLLTLLYVSLIGFGWKGSLDDFM